MTELKSLDIWQSENGCLMYDIGFLIFELSKSNFKNQVS